MSTPAILYDHVPVALNADETDGHKQQLAKGGGYCRTPKAILAEHRENTGNNVVSYFVSSVVYQVSAPPEHEDDAKKQEQQEQQSNSSDDDENSVCGPQMETVWEDFDTAYVFVPRSSLGGEDTNNYVDANVTLSHYSHASKMNRIRHHLYTLGSSIASSSSWPRRTFQGLLTKGLLKPVYYVSTYASSILPSSTSIYKSYDWVSETVIDESGNRLILPGPLINLDSTTLDQNDSKSYAWDGGGQTSPFLCASAQNDDIDNSTLIVPASSDTAVDHVERDCAVPSSCGPISSSSPWWPSHTIMVSAHDLLAVQQQQTSQHQNNHLSGAEWSPSSSSLWIVPEEGEQQQGQRLSRCSMSRPQWVASRETDSIVQQWTHALWKLAKRRTMRWYRLSCFRIRQTVCGALSSSQEFMNKGDGDAHNGSFFTESSILIPHCQDRADEEAAKGSELATSLLILPAIEDIIQSSNYNSTDPQSEHDNVSTGESENQEVSLGVTIEMTSRNNKNKQALTRATHLEV
mmetsp:Transcript_27834/g.49425  ORF Transcript_27834/g.49425 Transcript_27834/m.49425 type:complete len:518 (+) Transcript_27834:95-1648(+)